MALHYINFTAGADLTISVSLADLFVQAYQRQESSTIPLESLIKFVELLLVINLRVETLNTSRRVAVN